MSPLKKGHSGVGNRGILIFRGIVVVNTGVFFFPFYVLLLFVVDFFFEPLFGKSERL